MEASLVVALVAAALGAVSGVAALIRSRGQNRNEEVEKIAGAYDALQRTTSEAYASDYERKERDLAAAREQLAACEDDRDSYARRLRRYVSEFGRLSDDE